MTTPNFSDDWRPWAGERLSELAAAIAFLTRLPLPERQPVAAGALAKAAWVFPLAGVAVGVIGAIAYALAHRLGLPPWPAAALTVAATLAVTGALHEDGLADVADGFGGGATREQKLEIMRDARIGTYGACALALSIVIRAGVLADLATTGAVAAALIAAHAAARAAMPVMMFLLLPARSDGLGFDAGAPEAMRMLAGAALAVIILLLCLGPLRTLAAIIVLAIVIALLAWLAVRQIGGQTGDVLGAVEQVSEIAVLLVALG